MKIYIYSYINKKTGNRYIGKTNDIERRKREHKSMAYNSHSHYYNTIWAKKIREYGYENFDFEVLEVTNEEKWSEREKFWIDYYNTYKGKGYNMTPGGDTNTQNLILNDEEAMLIKKMLKEHKYTEKEIALEYGVSVALVSNINQGLRYYDEKEKYPLFKYYKNGLEDYSKLIELLKTTTKTFKEIANELHIAESTIKKINYGKMWYDQNINYPIRKINCFNKNIDKIRELLINTDKSFSAIAKETEKSITTIKRINNGETHYDSKYIYPLRH